MCVTGVKEESAGDSRTATVGRRGTDADHHNLAREMLRQVVFAVREPSSRRWLDDFTVLWIFMGLR